LDRTIVHALGSEARPFFLIRNDRKRGRQERTTINLLIDVLFLLSYIPAVPDEEETFVFLIRNDRKRGRQERTTIDLLIDVPFLLSYIPALPDEKEPPVLRQDAARRFTKRHLPGFTWSRAASRATRSRG
jgi:hypothetical protein